MDVRTGSSKQREAARSTQQPKKQKRTREDVRRKMMQPQQVVQNEAPLQMRSQAAARHFLVTSTVSVIWEPQMALLY